VTIIARCFDLAAVLSVDPEAENRDVSSLSYELLIVAQRATEARRTIAMADDG
jgi:hypothetical protein